MVALLWDKPLFFMVALLWDKPLVPRFSPFPPLASPPPQEHFEKHAVKWKHCREPPGDRHFRGWKHWKNKKTKQTTPQKTHLRKAKGAKHHLLSLLNQQTNQPYSGGQCSRDGDVPDASKSWWAEAAEVAVEMLEVHTPLQNQPDAVRREQGKVWWFFSASSSLWFPKRNEWVNSIMNPPTKRFFPTEAARHTLMLPEPLSRTMADPSIRLLAPWGNNFKICLPQADCFIKGAYWLHGFDVFLALVVLSCVLR